MKLRVVGLTIGGILSELVHLHVSTLPHDWASLLSLLSFVSLL